MPCKYTILGFYSSKLMVTALILSIFGFFTYIFNAPALAGSDQIVKTDNFRKPVNNEELKYWLENMIWYHHFTNIEITAATGLTNEEIYTASL